MFLNMVRENQNLCPICGNELKHYDKVKRIVRTKNHKSYWISINRSYCIKCHSVHRVIPNYMYPYKQYEAEVINGVIEKLITPETLGFEDYPCETTFREWLSIDFRVLNCRF